MLILEIADIKSRAERVGITLSELAQSVGIHPTTAYRCARGAAGPRLATAQRLTDALVECEREALKRLQQLHPDAVKVEA